jgi:hypothetical protein
MDEITHRLDQMTTSRTFVDQSSTNPPMEPPQASMICSSTKHLLPSCPSTSQFLDLVQEYVNATQYFTQLGNNPFSNTYNSGWRDHPNFGWRQQNQAPNF